MSSSLISLALFKKKSMIHFVAITWRMPGGGRSSSHLLPDNMAQNEKRCDRHRATCTSASRLAHVMLCKQYSPHVRMSHKFPLTVTIKLGHNSPQSQKR